MCSAVSIASKGEGGKGGKKRAERREEREETALLSSLPYRFRLLTYMHHASMCM